VVLSKGLAETTIEHCFRKKEERKQALPNIDEGNHSPNLFFFANGEDLY
jgi:hypothetical protein